MFIRSYRAILSLAVLLMLSACSTIAPPPPTTAQPDEAASTTDAASESAEDVDSEATRGILRVPHNLISEGAESLNPASPNDFIFANLMLYDRLVGVDEEGMLVPELSEEWNANDDATEWTFSLRNDVTFHNGQPFTSADVAYTFAQIRDPATESPAASIFGLIEETETPDQHTIVFRLSQPHADFPLLVASHRAAIIPADSAETIGDTGIGTGPFKLEILDAEGTTVLTANDDYWQGEPGLAGVELPAIADSEARTLAAQAGQIDLLFSLSPAQAELLEQGDNFELITFPSSQWIGLTMLTDAPPFDDVRVREAMRLIADRQQIIALVVDGNGVLSCDTPVGPNDVYRWDTECPQDIEKAKALLAEAGYAEGLDVTLYASPIAATFVSLAEVYQQQAVEAGVNVTVEIVPPNVFLSEIFSTEPFYVIGWNGRSADEFLNTIWRSTAPLNESHFESAEFDQLLDDARTELDFEERKEIYQEAQRLIAEEGGHLIPFHSIETHAASGSVSGVQPRTVFEMEWHTISKSE